MATASQAATAWFSSAGLTTLTGTSAPETFYGGETVSVAMTGGGGDDTYYIYSKGDKAIELAGGGVDSIVAWRSISLANFANIENLSVGSDDNYAVGNAGDNFIQGMDGRQQIYGAGGEDVLLGGAGADTFIVRKGEGNDSIQDFSVAEDKVRLDAGITSFSVLQSRFSQVGADTFIDLGGGDGLVMRNVTASQLTASHFKLGLDVASLDRVTFADEFSGPLSYRDAVHAPNGVWNTDYGYQGANGVGSYTLVSNNEKQIYTSPYFRDHNGDFSESPFVMNSDGTLSIWARPSSNSEIFGYGYTSGALTTKGSFAQTYGYFEIRADVPTAAGAWPAFWLVPTDGSWPPELDVMETLSGEPDMAWTSAHSAASGSQTSVGVANYVMPTSDGMHTYGTLWTPTELIYYIDRVEVFRTPTPADMNKPMHLIINLALGGWAGDLDLAALPAEFKIDYVRAYNLAGSGGGAPVESVPPAPAPAPSPAQSLFILPTSGAHTATINGGAKKDTLSGTSANELLDGKGNADTMAGGAGDDTYAVDRAEDVVTELAGAGIDTVLSTSSAFTLGANLENLKLVGNGVQTATGNALGNILTGAAGTTILSGAGGDDILRAGTGATTLTGGSGKDIFQFDKAPSAASKITDFTLGEDMIDLRAMFAEAKYAGSDPIADLLLSLKSDGAGGTNIYFDADGAGLGSALLVVDVAGVAPTALHVGSDWFFQ